MRLADFIRANREPILADWEEFARLCSPASITMNNRALRDHAAAMLNAFAEDLETYQSPEAQIAKSRGQASETAMEPSAATLHGAGRANSGFDIEQMVAEYRALRASVLRLWTNAKGGLDGNDLEDLIRFNEAIDQALAESVAAFDQSVEQSKELFIGMLGHDLRTPLGAILTSALFMLESGSLQPTQRDLTARIVEAARRTTRMVGDLLDFTRSRLGDGIPVAREEVDLEDLVLKVVDEVVSSGPDSQIRVRCTGDLQGEWDAARLRQALTNIVVNAVQHGEAGQPIAVEARGEAEIVSVAVHNKGAVIPGDQLDGIFNPLKDRRFPGRRSAPRGPTDSLGLGLYIAERIVSAHGGYIEVESGPDTGTTFTVNVPRAEQSAMRA
ncbi:MAG TPA: sensor histidine kinase [Longimicrobiales bacterium]|nr:sensor histidine kinase [Longimicrobiales bacterium]